MVKSFRDLLAWQKAHELVLGIYAATKSFPREEQFSLTNQMRRSAVSVAANIAEGSARASTPDLLHFLSIASGSLAEVKYFLILAQDLGYLPQDAAPQLSSTADECGRLIGGLRRSLRKN